MCNPRDSELWLINNSGIFRILTYLKPDRYSETSQRFKMECFNKIDESCNYFSKAFPANISTSDRRCFNVVDQRWNNVDPTLKMKQNPTSDFQRCTTLIQRRCPTLKQRWYYFISMLFQCGLNISKNYTKTSRASDKYGFVNL